MVELAVFEILVLVLIGVMVLYWGWTRTWRRWSLCRAIVHEVNYQPGIPASLVANRLGASEVEVRQLVKWLEGEHMLVMMPDRGDRLLYPLR